MKKRAMKMSSTKSEKEAKERNLKASNRQNPEDLEEGDIIKGWLPGKNYIQGVFHAYDDEKQTKVKTKVLDGGSFPPFACGLTMSCIAPDIIRYDFDYLTCILVSNFWYGWAMYIGPVQAGRQ